MEKKQKPDKVYQHKGYTVKVYYGDKTQEEVIREVVKMMANECIKKLANT